MDYESYPIHETIIEAHIVGEEEPEVSDGIIFNALNAYVFDVIVEYEVLSAEEEVFEIENSLVCGILVAGGNREAPVTIAAINAKRITKKSGNLEALNDSVNEKADDTEKVDGATKVIESGVETKELENPLSITVYNMEVPKSSKDNKKLNSKRSLMSFPMTLFVRLLVMIMMERGNQRGECVLNFLVKTKMKMMNLPLLQNKKRKFTSWPKESNFLRPR